jgi:hypothetical protein
MKTAFAVFAAAAIFMSTMGGAEAAPIAPAGMTTKSNIIQTAQGCGRGWHRGPRGGCRRNVTPNWPCWYVRGPYGRWRLVCH